MMYLLHASILIGVIYLVYHLLLGNETFFAVNRLVLAGGIVLAFVLPKLEVPADWSLASIYALNTGQHDLPTSVSNTIEPSLANPEIILEAKENLHGALNNVSDGATATSPDKVDIAGDESAQAGTQAHFIKNTKEAGSLLSGLSSINFWGIYLAGFIFFLGLMLLQLARLAYYIAIGSPSRIGNMKILESAHYKTSFSFMNLVFINGRDKDSPGFDQILSHEAAHIRARHSWDMLLAQILVMVQWFNPFAWMYKRALENNLEFLADRRVLESGVDPVVYQMNLLKVALSDNRLSLANHYNQSFLKKRIIMMKSKQSTMNKAWKYAVLLVILCFSVSCLNLTAQTEGKSESEKAKITVPPPPPPPPPVKPQLPSPATQPSPPKAPGIVMPPPPLPPPSPAGVPMPAPYAIPAPPAPPSMVSPPPPPPPPPARPRINMSGTFQKSGKWTGEIEDGEFCLEVNNGSGKKHQMTWHDCLDLDEFTPRPANGVQSFSLARDAGTIKFEGKIAGKKGSGEYVFTPNEAFKSSLANQGVKGVEDAHLFHFTILDIDRPMAESLANIDMDLTGDDLIALAIHDLDASDLDAYATALSDSGISSYSIEDLIQLTIHDVDPEYVDAVGRLDIPGLKVADVVQLSIHDIDERDIEGYVAAGIEPLTIANMVQLGIHDIDAEYVAELKNAGLTDMRIENIVQLGLHDVDTELIEAFEQMEGPMPTTQQIVGASIQGVDESFIRELNAAGLKNLSISEITQLAMHDVDADYVAGFKSSGMPGLTTQQIIQGSMFDVDISFLKALNEAGLRNVSFEDLIRFTQHDVDIELIAGLKSAGIENLSNEDILRASMHDVDVSELDRLKTLGVINITISDLIQFQQMDMDADDIEKLVEKGHKGLTLKGYVDLIMKSTY